MLAAGVGSRYGSTKQLDTVGPSGETLSDYALWDAIRSGAAGAVFVIRPELEPLFRDHHARWQGRLPITYAHQRLDALPDGFRVPAGRTRPWGTTHAVLAAAVHLQLPFAVLNADDLYGRRAIETLAAFLIDASPLRATVALVPYHLRDTLSPHGGVSRAVIEADASGRLRRLIEVTGIAPREGVLTGHRGGRDVSLRGDEWVSMNCWGFRPGILPMLRAGFARFLGEHGGSPTAECPLPDTVQELVAEGGVTAQMLAGGSDWLGVTHAADRPAVVEGLRRLVATGGYPANLFE